MDTENKWLNGEEDIINIPEKDHSIDFEHTLINFVNYNKTQYTEKIATNFDFLDECLKQDRINWIDVIGTNNKQLLESLGERFDFHPLVIEDISSTNQRLKLDYFQNHLFIIINALNYVKETKTLELEQVSIILGKNFVLTFQELPPNQFEPIHERIKNNQSRVRKYGPDYLAYTILDLLVDHYFFILEDFSEDLEDLQDELVNNPTPENLNAIYKIRKDMIKLRKATWPLREVISRLSKMDSPFIKDTTEIYLRDVYDHVIQIIETIETYREMLSGMIDVFISSISNKMNQIMKVLTIISTIFIPLTFIVGIYGMNFPNMPEFAWPWSYLIVMIAMLVIAIGMIVFFKRKKWF
ncbi:MAG: magnesium/cobalt transporter CorA [Candidatus Heimdallarchaeota archaeon]|nr:magnesium/cobalt transporter CorA [Candidatus Heimdallarchaeota archaeon]